MRCERLAHRVAEEFDALKPWLPKAADGFLDIGCGLACIDVLIARHYGPLFVHVMDGNGAIENRQMGFNASTKAWANVEVAADLLRANLSADYVVVDHVADERATIAADLIVSLKSWGHHYPVSVYLPLAMRSLRKGARIILDIRRKTNGRKLLENAGFTMLGKVQENAKCERLVFQR